MQMCAESENHHFSQIFFNMDISLIIALIRLKTCMYNHQICSEGRVSQNVDIELSFCFIVCRRWKLEKKYKKLQKLPFFVIK